MSRLRDLQERRAYECRLTPDRALETLDEAEAFLDDRGLLTRTPDSALPSLYEACHDEPYAPGRGGFGEWPASKWWWAGALAGREGVYKLKIHRGKTILVSDEVAAIVDPICRSEIERMARADPEWARLLRHLEATGPALLEDLQAELALKPKELKALRYPLELCGAVVSRALVAETAGGGHEHTSELARWDQVFAEPRGSRGGFDELLVAGVRAAVVAPERELKGWFAWRWLYRDDLVDRLVDEGRLERPEPGWLTTPPS